MALETKQPVDGRPESAALFRDMGVASLGSEREALGAEGSRGGPPAAAGIQADTIDAARSTRRPILVSPADRNPVWITMACGQRFCTDQIGSMFGRE